MQPGTHDGPESALRPLRAAGGAIAALRAGSLSDEEARSAGVQIASAVEMSLRRLLRDQPQVALPVRLRALAPDELSADEVLSELRQHERISMALAASVHDLLEARRRLKAGSPLAPSERAGVLEVVDRVEREVLEPRSAPLPGPSLPPEDATVAYQPEEEPAAPRRWRTAPVLGTVAAMLLLLLALGLWAARRGGDDVELEQGIALFRSGAYADAASHFYRHAQANPDDPTPRLYLARVHRQLKRYDLATQAIQEALEVAPEDAAVYTELGLLLGDVGRYDEAVARLREAIRLDPESQLAWAGLVRVLRAAGREDAAARVLAQAPAEIRAMLTRPAAPADSLTL